MVKTYTWNPEKNEYLKATRNISFEEVVNAIAEGKLLDIIEHPNQERYRGQRLFIVEINEYVCMVPFRETEHEMFLKTIIPSRKATRKYLGEQHGI